MRTHLRVVALALISILPASTLHAAKTAFRLTDLDWRDPHFFALLPLGCMDFTNLEAFGIEGINPTLQNQLELDGDFDGELDLNYLIVFDPLNQAGSGGTLQFGTVSCTAPLASTACEPFFPLPSYSYDNTPALCLGTVPGTTNGGYTPALVQPASPCFVAALGDITLGIPFPVSLADAYLAAEYSGNPATGLVDGMIRGFIPESVANQTIIPEGSSGIDVIDGEPLSSLFRGGANSCSQPAPATGDKDIGPGGVPGWYVYFNFTAMVVPYTEPPTAVRPGPISSLVLHAPVPNPFNPLTTIRYNLPRASSVQLSVYDTAGRRVARLAAGRQTAGEHVETWNGRDSHGQPVSSGVYFIRLDTGDEVRVRKVALLK